MKPATRKALRLLKDAGDQGVTTGDFLNQGIGRFSARIAELREAGHHVVSKRESNNRHRYFLRSPSSPASDAIDDDAGLGGNAHAGVPSARNARTPLPADRSLHPAGPTLPRVRRGDPPERVYREDPRFSWDRPPSIAGEWICTIELRRDEPNSAYWERQGAEAQTELAAAA